MFLKLASVLLTLVLVVAHPQTEPLGVANFLKQLLATDVPLANPWDSPDLTPEQKVGLREFWWQVFGWAGHEKGTPPSEIFDGDSNFSLPEFPLCPEGHECVPWEDCVDAEALLDEHKRECVKTKTNDTLKCGQDGNMCCAIIGIPVKKPVIEKDKPINLDDQCGHPSYDCVPFFQCDNGVINTDGFGLIDVRIKPKGTCINPEYPDSPAICCLIPGQPTTPSPLEAVCPDTDECIDRNRCATNGSSGEWLSKSAESNITRKELSSCNRLTGEAGICCTKSQILSNHCKQGHECVPWERCIKGSISTGDLKGDHQKPDNYDSLKCGQEGHMCCASSLPHLPDHTVSLKDQCGHPSYDCVPYFQCDNGVINTGGEGLLDVRILPKGTCYNPEYKDVPAVCCLIPEGETLPPLDPCPKDKECVDPSQCSSDGFIIDDGAGLIGLRIKHTICRKPDAELGICCTPPPDILELCPNDTICVDSKNCTEQALDLSENLKRDSPTETFNKCSLIKLDKTGVCCPPPPKTLTLENCPTTSKCIEPLLCLGTALDDQYNYLEYHPTGRWIPCIHGLSHAGEPGICCIQPPPSHISCPITSKCMLPSSCQGEAMNLVSNFVTYNSTRSNWALCDQESSKESGICCINPTIQELPPASKCGMRNYQVGQGIQSGNAENEATFGEFPWQSIIFYQDIYKCGASLISDRHVITAAHCVHNLIPDDIRIRLGEWKVNNLDQLPYVDRNISILFMHPMFNPRTVHNNIAILQLAEPVKLKYHINTVCLPSVEQKFVPGEGCFATGWGKDSFQGNFRNILKKIDLPYIEQGLCQDLLRKTRLGRRFRLDKSFNCAGGEENKDACYGDGGGPLVCKNPVTGQYVLTGITAWGIECGLKDVPGVYANVQHFKAWIDEIIHGYDHQLKL